MLRTNKKAHPNLYALLKVVFSIAANTGLLEKSYSTLAKLSCKDRYKLNTGHIETQLILATLQGVKRHGL